MNTKIMLALCAMIAGCTSVSAVDSTTNEEMTEEVILKRLNYDKQRYDSFGSFEKGKIPNERLKKIAEELTNNINEFVLDVKRETNKIAEELKKPSYGVKFYSMFELSDLGITSQLKEINSFAVLLDNFSEFVKEKSSIGKVLEKIAKIEQSDHAMNPVLMHKRISKELFSVRDLLGSLEAVLSSYMIRLSDKGNSNDSPIFQNVPSGTTFTQLIKEHITKIGDSDMANRKACYMISCLNQIVAALKFDLKN